MFRSFFSLLAGLCLLNAAQAQPGALQWSRTPLAPKGFDRMKGPFCAPNGRAYTLSSKWNSKDGYIGYVFPEEGKAPGFSKPVPIPPDVKGRDNLNAFFMLGERPCAVYDRWDEGTGRVTLYAQAFTPDLDPDGAAVQVGVIPLDAKSYQGSHLNVSPIESPDRSKVLLLFDDIQSGGIKLAMCWVFNAALEPLWQGAYRLPVQSYGAGSTAYLLDNGHVYMRMNGVVLTEDNVKEKKDGSLQAKTDKKYWKHDVTTWYELHGETFHMWDCKLPSLKGSFSGIPMLLDGRVVMGGRVVFDDEDARPTWVFVALNEGMVPEVLTSGPPPATDDDALDSFQLLVDRSGHAYLKHDKGWNGTLIKFDGTFRPQWERPIPATGTIYMFEDRLYMPLFGTQDDREDLEKGERWRPHCASRRCTPFVLAWNAQGERTSRSLLPEGTTDAHIYDNGGFKSIERCGAYVDQTYDKKRPGLVRLPLE